MKTKAEASSIAGEESPRSDTDQNQTNQTPQSPHSAQVEKPSTNFVEPEHVVESTANISHTKPAVKLDLQERLRRLNLRHTSPENPQPKEPHSTEPAVKPLSAPGPTKPTTRPLHAETSAPRIESIKIAHGKNQGTYTIHSVALLFPSIEGKALNELRNSINNHGQQEPVVVDGKILLDGRNRVMLLNELGLETRTIQFSELKSNLSAHDWIITKNLDRRHLTDDQRLAITAKYLALSKLRRDASTVSGSNEVEKPSKAHDDGAKDIDNSGISEYRQKSAENRKGSKRGRPSGSRSEAKALAKKTNQSRYRAEEMLNLQKAPPLASQVETGELTLKEATRKFKAQQPKKQVKPQRPPDIGRIEKAVLSAERWLCEKSHKLRLNEQSAFWAGIISMANVREKMTKETAKEMDQL